MKWLLIACCLSITGYSYAQTKKIAYKSHSGDMMVFRDMLETNSGGTEHSNFGMMPDPVVREAVLDSLILLCDTATIMVTSEQCTRKRAPGGAATRWQKGRDTVYHHPYFNNSLPVDSIRRILKQRYFFNNPEQTIFVGFGTPITQRTGNKNKELTSTSRSSSAPVIPMLGLLLIPPAMGIWPNLKTKFSARATKF